MLEWENRAGGITGQGKAEVRIMPGSMVIEKQDSRDGILGEEGGKGLR